LLPDPAKRVDPSAPLYLDEAAIQTPSVALACAARETLHMGDVVEDMLGKAMTALMTNDRKLAAEVSRMDNIVDRLDEAIKLYVTKVTRESLDDRDGRRAMEIISLGPTLPLPTRRKFQHNHRSEGQTSRRPSTSRRRDGRLSRIAPRIGLGSKPESSLWAVMSASSGCGHSVA
jgi:hypothetical protein